MILNFFVGNFELDFFQISLCIALQHRRKSFLAQIVPFLVLVRMFLKLDFVQSLVVLQTISHQHHSFLRYISEMSFLDKAVCVASFYDSNKTIFSQINILEAYFFDGMLVILYQGVSDVYACFQLESLVFGENQLSNIHGAFSLESFLKVKARLNNEFSNYDL